MVPVTRPSPPTAVTATSGYNSVVVKWSPPSSNGFSPLTGYDIYEATSGPRAVETAIGSSWAPWVPPPSPIPSLA